MKKHFTYSVLVVLAILSLGLSDVTAAPSPLPTGENTAVPESTATPEPTPILNEIDSIGDFKLKAGYSDNSIFESDMAVNVREIRDEAETEPFIRAVRQIERDQDIISIFEITLQKNGRDTELTKQLNIRIEQSGQFLSYDTISVFRIDTAGMAHRLETTVEYGYICYTTAELGTFALSGVLLPGQTEAPTELPSASPTLQNDGNTGIITPPGTDAESGRDTEEGIVTPGAFVFWLVLALLLGFWIGIGIGYLLWGRYKTKKTHSGPRVIGE